MEGRFDEAEAMFKRSLAANPKMTGSWAGLVGIRKVTTSDVAWLKGAEEIAASGIAPMEEADMRFAIGKYCDDVGDFEQAFLSYKRGNELLKSVAENYGRNERTRFVDTQMGIYTRETLSCKERRFRLDKTDIRSRHAAFRARHSPSKSSPRIHR